MYYFCVTDDMKDFPLRAWVLNGSQEYKIKQTKVHGDVRAVNVTLQGENKVHLLFTVLSTDQRSKKVQIEFINYLLPLDCNCESYIMIIKMLLVYRLRQKS